MTDDMLSQDEINELLKGLTSNEEDSADPLLSNEKESVIIEDYISDIEQDALGEIGNISFGSSATALSTLLNQKVEITTPQLSIVLKDKLNKEFPQPHVAIHVQYTEGFEGVNILVIKQSDAAIIADLMLGGDGLNPDIDLSEMHISAVQEAMNQMMGSASTSMSTIFNKKVDISPPRIDLLDFEKNEGTDQVPADNILVKVSFRLKIGQLIDSAIMQLVTVPFAKHLVHQLMNPESEPKVVQAVERVQPNLEREPAPIQQPTREVAEPIYESRAAEHAPPFQQAHETQLLGSSLQSLDRQVNIQPASFSTFDVPQLSNVESKNLNMLLDIPLQVTVELGRTSRSIKEILEYTQGSIIELDKLAGEPIDILVNKKLVAKGEVVVIDENFGVRITDIVSQEDRIKNLK
ncbi:flagellar motor switch phosphatase FliY [bacterium LRH843]|nr:flagellar motor switch phosphatase FliY [bacterium LRH843]